MRRTIYKLLVSSTRPRSDCERVMTVVNSIRTVKTNRATHSESRMNHLEERLWHDSRQICSRTQSNSPPSNSVRQVVIEWVDFIGTGIFCFMMCNPSDKEAAKLFQHTYDCAGCECNAPIDYGSIDGKFEVCDSDNITFPGQCVSNGITTSWTQGPDSIPESPLYTSTAPAASNCLRLCFRPRCHLSISLSVPSPTSPTGASSRSGSGANPAQTGSAASLRSLPYRLMVVSAAAILSSLKVRAELGFFVTFGVLPGTGDWMTDHILSAMHFHRLGTGNTKTLSAI